MFSFALFQPQMVEVHKRGMSLLVGSRISQQRIFGKAVQFESCYKIKLGSVDDFNNGQHLGIYSIDTHNLFSYAPTAK